MLIDIGADSVAGAYARYEEDAMPVLLHMQRMPIVIRENESYESAMLRALTVPSEPLMRPRGAWARMRETRSIAAYFS